MTKYIVKKRNEFKNDYDYINYYFRGYSVDVDKVELYNELGHSIYKYITKLSNEEIKKMILGCKKDFISIERKITNKLQESKEYRPELLDFYYNLFLDIVKIFMDDYKKNNYDPGYFFPLRFNHITPKFFKRLFINNEQIIEVLKKIDKHIETKYGKYPGINDFFNNKIEEAKKMSFDEYMKFYHMD